MVVSRSPTPLLFFNHHLLIYIHLSKELGKLARDRCCSSQGPCKFATRSGPARELCANGLEQCLAYTASHLGVSPGAAAVFE